MEMHRKVIGGRENVLAILEGCMKKQVIFEITDEEGNLLNLSIEHIIRMSRRKIIGLLSQDFFFLLLRFQTQPQFPPALHTHHNYPVFFRHKEKAYSFRGKLSNFDPDNSRLTLFIPDSLHVFPKRKFHRLPVDVLDRMLIDVQIQENSYDLFNLSREGMAILIDNPDKFRLGQEISLRISLRVFSRVHIFEAQGKVKHITSLEENGTICGIAIQYQQEQDLLYIHQLIHQVIQDRSLFFKVTSLFR